VVTKKRKLNVEDAYALKTPDDSIRLYGEWASTYDSDFVGSSAYVLYRHIAEVFLHEQSSINGAVLDVGCGTGVVGECLRACGVAEVDGIDISQPMLAEAARKTTGNDDRVYRKLIAADLTKKLDIADNQYAGLISAGTFTHGHLGPDPLDELWRVAAPGAICAIGIRSTHFESLKFGEKLSDDVQKRIITKPKLVEVRIYSEEADNSEHADDKACVVVCQTV